MDSGVYVVAHELKSPWATMRQLALNLDPDNLNPTKHKMVSLADRAMRQVTELTKVARLADGLFQLEPVSVRSVCDEVSSEIDDLYHLSNRTLRLSFRNRTRLVIANRDLLRSVIYNFCTNALHYSEPNSSSSLTVIDHGDCVRIQVRDYGPALPTEIWKSINTNDFSSPTSIAMRPGSTGLGLYIASRFSDYMHADITAIRHRDGTSLIIDLPVSRQLTLFSATPSH